MMYFKSKKRKKYMCKKLKEIHEMNVSDILRTYCLQQKNFDCENIVDIVEILNFLGIAHDVISFEELEKSLFLKGNDIILGMACSEGDNVRILCSNNLDPKEKNYVLAHELAHCCLHLPVSAEFHVELKTKSDIYSSFLAKPLRDKQVSKKELEADLFAADLLIPTELLLGYLRKSELFSVKDISDHFNVPESLVHKKIMMLSKRN